MNLQEMLDVEASKVRFSKEEFEQIDILGGETEDRMRKYHTSSFGCILTFVESKIAIAKYAGGNFAVSRNGVVSFGSYSIKEAAEFLHYALSHFPKEDSF